MEREEKRGKRRQSQEGWLGRQQPKEETVSSLDQTEVDPGRERQQNLSLGFWLGAYKCSEL